MSGHGHIDPSNKKVALLIAVLALVLAFSETLGKVMRTIPACAEMTGHAATGGARFAVAQQTA